MGRRRTRRLLAGLALAVSACAGQAGERLREVAERSHSWTATARMVVDAWSAGSVPTPYARDTLEAAARALRAESETLARAHDLDPAIPGSLGRLAETVETLATAAGAADAPAVRAARARLDAIEPQLQRLVVGSPGSR